MRVWSLTPFCREVDVLEIRLATLDPVVDVHVLVEATVTQTGRAKPVFRDLSRGRLARWAHKIRLVTVDDMPGGTDDWRREKFQRDAAMRACHGMEGTDRVLLSDVDEIPHPAALLAAVARDRATRIEMDMHLYRLNWRWRERPVRYGTRALVVDGRALMEEPPSQLVEFKAIYPWVSGGWHLAYQGTREQILAKVNMIADQWCRDRGVTGRVVERAIERGTDIYGRPERQCEWCPDQDLPEYVQANRERFAHMLIPEPQPVAA